MQNVLCVYHAPCLDGFTAAWVVHAAYRAQGRDVDLVPAKYGDPPPDVTGRDVVVVDFSYPRELLLTMREKAESLIVIDHHKSAAEELEGLPFARFDMARSGAGMAWDHFFSEQSRSWIVDCVEDRDLWRFALPPTQEVTAYLAALPQTIDAWDGAHLLGLGRAAAAGRAIRMYVDRVVADTLKLAAQGRLAQLAPQVEVPIVNTMPSVASEVGNALALGAPFAVLWYQDGEGFYRYSLRSSAENPEHMDVSAIAKIFGGGGHKHAAGMRTPIPIHTLVL